MARVFADLSINTCTSAAVLISSHCGTSRRATCRAAAHAPRPRVRQSLMCECTSDCVWMAGEGGQEEGAGAGAYLQVCDKDGAVLSVPVAMAQRRATSLLFAGGAAGP